MLDLHDEREHIAMRLAAVAIEPGLRRIHREAGIAVGVERTAPLEYGAAVLAPCRFELDSVALDNSLDRISRADGVLIASRIYHQSPSIHVKSRARSGGSGWHVRSATVHDHAGGHRDRRVCGRN